MYISVWANCEPRYLILKQKKYRYCQECPGVQVVKTHTHNLYSNRKAPSFILAGDLSSCLSTVFCWALSIKVKNSPKKSPSNRYVSWSVCSPNREMYYNRGFFFQFLSVSLSGYTFLLTNAFAHDSLKLPSWIPCWMFAEGIFGDTFNLSSKGKPHVQIYEERVKCNVMSTIAFNQKLNISNTRLDFLWCQPHICLFFFLNA